MFFHAQHQMSRIFFCLFVNFFKEVTVLKYWHISVLNIGWLKKFLSPLCFCLFSVFKDWCGWCFALLEDKGPCSQSVFWNTPGGREGNHLCQVGWAGSCPSLNKSPCLWPQAVLGLGEKRWPQSFVLIKSSWSPRFGASPGSVLLSLNILDSKIKLGPHWLILHPGACQSPPV